MKKIFAILVLFFISSFAFVLADDMRFIQVDNLLYSSKNENSKKMFAKIIDDINRQKNVEFIVFSGNNIAKPDREILTSFLKEAKKLNRPYYVILGNKDVNKAKDLSKKDYMKIVSKKNRAHKRVSEPNYVFIKKGMDKQTQI